MEKSQTSDGMSMGFLRSIYSSTLNMFIFCGHDFLATPMNARVFVHLPEGTWNHYKGRLVEVILVIQHSHGKSPIYR